MLDRLYGEHRIVLRAFRTDELNTLRISPNMLNTREEIDRLFDLLDIETR